MDSSVQTLPPASDLSSSVLSFLDDKFDTKENLNDAPRLVSELHTHCSDLDRTLTDLNRRLGASLVAYATFSDQFDGIFNDINAKLISLGSSTRSHGSISGGSIGFLCKYECSYIYIGTHSCLLSSVCSNYVNLYLHIPKCNLF